MLLKLARMQIHFWSTSVKHVPKKRERLQLLRLLKSGLAETMLDAAALVGTSKSAAQRHWRVYKASGIAAMCTLAYKGEQSRLSARALEQLEMRCREGFSNPHAAAT